MTAKSIPVGFRLFLFKLHLMLVATGTMGWIRKDFLFIILHSNQWTSYALPLQSYLLNPSPPPFPHPLPLTTHLPPTRLLYLGDCNLSKWLLRGAQSLLALPFFWAPGGNQWRTRMCSQGALFSPESQNSSHFMNTMKSCLGSGYGTWESSELTFK